MKKSVFLVGFLIVSMFLSSKVYAYNQNSGYHAGPEAYADGKYYTSSVYSLSSANAPITGSETAVYFKSLGWLRKDVCVADYNDERELTIYLMEQDSWPDSDDSVKKYVGSFYGWNLQSIKYKGYANSSSNGNLESAGDQTGEFYIKHKMNYLTGDKTTTNGELYYFDIRVD